MPVPRKPPGAARRGLSKTPPACASACAAVASANGLARPSMGSGGVGKWRAASKATAAPTGLARRSWNFPARRAIPDRPALNAAKRAPVSLPSGETTPMPVTATRRTSGALARPVLRDDERIDVPREVAHGLHLLAQLPLLGRHRDPERVLDAEEDLDHAQRVDVEILEPRPGLERLGLQLEVPGEQRVETLNGGRGGVVHL